MQNIFVRNISCVTTDDVRGLDAISFRAIHKVNSWEHCGQAPLQLWHGLCTFMCADLVVHGPVQTPSLQMHRMTFALRTVPVEFFSTDFNDSFCQVAISTEFHRSLHWPGASLRVGWGSLVCHRRGQFLWQLLNLFGHSCVNLFWLEMSGWG